MAKTGARKLVKPVAAAIGVLGTMASIWWFALKPPPGSQERPEATPPPTAATEPGPASTRPRPPLSVGRRGGVSHRRP